MKAMIDGELVDRAGAQVSVFDHGFLYGDGVFEGIRAFGGRAFQLEAHLLRMVHGLRALDIELPGAIATLRDAVEGTLAAYGSEPAYVRLIVTRGEGPLGIDPTTCERPRVVCIVDALTVYSEDKRRAGLSLITSSYRRPGSDVLDPRVKTLNYLNNIQAKGEARRQGVDDALMLNQAGHVAEATVANVFVVREGRLLTPPTTDGCLDGITRATVLELAREAGIASREQTLTRIDLLASDECFLTGTGAGIVRVHTLDGRVVGHGEVGPVTSRLVRAHEALSK